MVQPSTVVVVSIPFRSQLSSASLSRTSCSEEAATMCKTSRSPSNGPPSRIKPSSTRASMKPACSSNPSCSRRPRDQSHGPPRTLRTTYRSLCSGIKVIAGLFHPARRPGRRDESNPLGRLRRLHALGRCLPVALVVRALGSLGDDAVLLSFLPGAVVRRRVHPANRVALQSGGDELRHLLGLVDHVALGCRARGNVLEGELTGLCRMLHHIGPALDRRLEELDCNRLVLLEPARLGEDAVLEHADSVLVVVEDVQ